MIKIDIGLETHYWQVFSFLDRSIGDVLTNTIASNPNTPADLLEELAERLILHPTDGKYFLNRSKQSYQKFLRAILQHPNLERNAAYGILLELYKREENAKVYEYVAEKENRL